MAKLWGSGLTAATALNQRDEYVEAIVFGTSVLATVGSAAVRASYVAAANVARRYPVVGAVIAMGLVLFAVWLLSRPKTKEAIKDAVPQARVALAEALPALRRAGDAVGAYVADAEAAETFLQGLEPAVVHGTLAREYLLPALARSAAPASPGRVSDLMRVLGYDSRGERPDTYVAELLRRSPFAVRTADGWVLRTESLGAAPM